MKAFVYERSDRLKLKRVLSRFETLLTANAELGIEVEMKNPGVNLRMDDQGKRTFSKLPASIVTFAASVSDRYHSRSI